MHWGDGMRQFAINRPFWFLPLAAVVWFAVYGQLEPLSFGLVGLLPLDQIDILSLEQKNHLAGALQFFLYDTPKVLMLLSGISFFMGMVHSYFTPERTRAFLSGHKLRGANVLAACLGIVTPFCSCSAITLFIGFLQAGVPLGVTFSFLIAAPMINEIALALLFGLFGWKVAGLYLGLGLTVAIVAGIILGRMNLEHLLEDWVQAIQKADPTVDHPRLSWGERVQAGFRSTSEIVGKTWPYIMGGIAIGGAIHGYVPEDFMASLMGKEAWWSVPLAVLIGVPMYTNAAGVIPIVQALLEKGAALGTVLAFMMSVVALSLPEMIILRRVLKPRLIATFVGIVSCGILTVGFVFNAVL